MPLYFPSGSTTRPLDLDWNIFFGIDEDTESKLLSFYVSSHIFGLRQALRRGHLRAAELRLRQHQADAACPPGRAALVRGEKRIAFGQGPCSARVALDQNDDRPFAEP
jgi:hypothetical protein